ncbi:MAG: c-type cytochrome [Planctomycetota bacterium]|nr:c-type cytochrome [Planctomycetota bacterium]
MNEAKEPIKIYLDEQKEPFKVDYPPLRFPLSTLPLADGAHVLRVEASNGLAPPTIKEIPFRVRNGVAVTVSGLEPNQTIGGQVELIVNAYAGNTEVDFEPRRAETPQPVPTWAWVLFLGILVWTLFYLVNPVQPPRAATATTFDVGREFGEQLYMDTCARCHGEDGRGLLMANTSDNYVVKKLRDTPRLALDETPYKLLFKVVTGTNSTGGVQMPPWGPRLTNEELVAVVNFVRTSWGHDASQIEPKYRRPPAGVEKLEQDILAAMVAKDVDAMSFCCWPERARPQLYRIDGPRWAVGREAVLDEWRGYFEALGAGKVVDFQLTDVRYDYEPEAVDEVGAYVFAMGRIFLSTRTADGQDESDTGRFIRVYRKVRTDAGPDGVEGEQWALLFDFASIRMRVGCDVEECDPELAPGSGNDVGTGDPVVIPGAGAGASVGYADIQAILAGLNRDPGDAGHEKFWELPYAEFVALEFPFSWDNTDETIKLIDVGNSAESNLVRALIDGKGLKVKLADGTYESRDIQRMPKGGAALDPAKVAIISAWIDGGCPEVAGAAPSAGSGSKDTEPKGADSKGADVPKKSADAGAPVGYADVQAMFAALGRDAGDAPHERFWELSHEEFCRFEFALGWDEIESIIVLISPWDGEGSNLVRALRDGAGISYRDAQGKEHRTTIKRMPKGGAAMPEADIARIVAWINAGCPHDAGGAPFFERKAGAGAPAGKDVPVKDAPAKSEPAKDAGSSEPPKRTSALGFDDVVKLFRDLRQKAPNAPHGNYWKDLDYAGFIACEFPLRHGEPWMIRMLVPYDSAASNMLKAFRDGRGLVAHQADGSTTVVDIAPMPKDAEPLSPEMIRSLADWIDAGCPEFAGKPSALPRPGSGGSAGQPAPPAPPPGDAPAEAPPPAEGGSGFPEPESKGSGR